MALNLRGFGEAFSQSFNKTFGQTLEDLFKKDAEKRKEKKAQKLRDSVSDSRYELAMRLAGDEAKKSVAGKFKPKGMHSIEEGMFDVSTPSEKMETALLSEKFKEGKDKARVMKDVMSDLLTDEAQTRRAEELRQKMRKERKQDANRPEKKATKENIGLINTALRDSLSTKSRGEGDIATRVPTQVWVDEGLFDENRRATKKLSKALRMGTTAGQENLNNLREYVAEKGQLPAASLIGTSELGRQVKSWKGESDKVKSLESNTKVLKAVHSALRLKGDDGAAAAAAAGLHPWPSKEFKDETLATLFRTKDDLNSAIGQFTPLEMASYNSHLARANIEKAMKQEAKDEKRTETTQEMRRVYRDQAKRLSEDFKSSSYDEEGVPAYVLLPYSSTTDNGRPYTLFKPIFDPRHKRTQKDIKEANSKAKELILKVNPWMKEDAGDSGSVDFGGGQNATWKKKFEPHTDE